MRGRFSINNGILTISPNIGDGIDTIAIESIAKEIKERLRIKIKPIDVITDRQRAFIMCICRDLALYYYGSKREQELVRRQVTSLFLDQWNHKANLDDILTIDKLSLSNCSKSIAWEFTQYLIEKCLWLGFEKFSGEFRNKLRQALEHDEFMYRYVLACLYHKTCAVCGSNKGIELHHYRSVAEGGGRKNDDGTKVPLITLCHHHHMEFHQELGREEWTTKYNLLGIMLSTKDAKELKKIYNFKKALEEDLEKYEGSENKEVL